MKKIYDFRQKSWFWEGKSGKFTCFFGCLLFLWLNVPIYYKYRKIHGFDFSQYQFCGVNLIVFSDKSKICREKHTKDVVNRYQEKVFAFDYDKRRIEYVGDDYGETFPFGYY